MRPDGKYHYYCTNCFFDMSQKESREWDYNDVDKIVYRDKCTKCGGDIDAGFPPLWVNRFKDYHFHGDDGCRMYAASYLPNQISEAKRVHPGREFKLVNGAYIPVIKNRTDRKKYLKEMNYIEYD